jgi:KDO2-lipid IV(A) lauroyltransferase
VAGRREEQVQQRLRKPQGVQSMLTGFIANIPQKHIANVGKSLGLLVYILDLRHRRIVRRNLQFAYPQWSLDRIRRLSKRVFQNLGITLLEICQMTCFSREDVLRTVRIRGEENLFNAIENPNGVIMISGHFGNWEIAHLAISCYLRKPLLLVARQIQSQRLHRWIHRLRVRFGNIILDKRGALPKMARTLHHGRALGLLIDQETKRSEGVEVTFFGRTAKATPSAALLARRYDSPVLPVFCIREGDSRLTLVAERPLALKRTDDPGADLKANTQIMTSAIEKAVRAYPDQWFWLHKRWKRYYPDLYPEDLARRQRRRQKKLSIYGPVRDEYAQAIHALLNGDLPKEWEWVESSSNSIVARRLKPSFTYYKEFLNRSPFEWLKSLFRGTRCDRARLQGEILGQKGFRSPEILCWGKQGNRHYIVTEGLNASGLGDLIIKHWRPPLSREQFHAKRKLVEQLGQEIGRLHKEGICHGDLRPNNILVRQTEKGVHFYFIDNERNRYFTEIPRRLIERNLVQVNMVFSPYVTLQDRLRFFNAYARTYPRFSFEEKRSLIQKVHQRTLRRLAAIIDRPNCLS